VKCVAVIHAEAIGIKRYFGSIARLACPAPRFCAMMNLRRGF
jgi:hypothetical protein